MRLYADYQTPIVEALAVLEDARIDQFPVDLKQIQRQYKNLFTIRSYGSFMKSTGMSRFECVTYFGSPDGAVVSQGSRYIIFYNELKRKQRTRFTIAHEMGHIFLDHHYEYGEPILDREGIGQQLYRRLENEASCFARNLLCPALHTEQLLDTHGISRIGPGNDGWVRTRETSATKNLSMMFYADTLIEQAFNVSVAAAEVRVGLLNADMNKYHKYDIDWKPTSHIKLTAAWVCSRCGLERLEGSIYCSECGQDHFIFQVSTAPFQYRDADINNALQFSSCPICGNSCYSANADYCMICGMPLKNTCTVDPAHINHPEANHCYTCGKSTAFNGSEYHNRVKQSLKQNLEGESLMKYESNIPFDLNTYKVLECPRCNNEIFSDDANFCQICGLEIVNICLPEQVEDSSGEYYTPEPHKNIPGARFCEECGAPTVYYQKHRILESSQTIRGTNVTEFDEDIPF